MKKQSFQVDDEKLRKTCNFLKYWDQSSDIDKEFRWKWPPEQRALWNAVLPVYHDRIKLLQDYYLLNGVYGHFIRHYFLSSDKIRTEAMNNIYIRRGIS